MCLGVSAAGLTPKQFFGMLRTIYSDELQQDLDTFDFDKPVNKPPNDALISTIFDKLVEVKYGVPAAHYEEYLIFKSLPILKN